MIVGIYASLLQRSSGKSNKGLFQPGNKEAAKQKGTTKITRKKIQQAIVKAVDILGQKLSKGENFTIEVLKDEAYKVILEDGLRSKDVRVRLEFSKMLFEHFSLTALNKS